MRSLAIALTLCLAPLPLAAQGSNRPAAPSQASAERQAARRTPPRAERTTVCRGAPIPYGWILVDNMREPSLCDGQNPQSLNLYNVWAIERYDNRPVGTTIDVCASTPTPEGWAMIDVYRDKDTCGHPTDPFQPNMKRIRRTR